MINDKLSHSQSFGPAMRAALPDNSNKTRNPWKIFFPLLSVFAVNFFPGLA